MKFKRTAAGILTAAICAASVIPNSILPVSYVAAAENAAVSEKISPELAKIISAAGDDELIPIYIFRGLIPEKEISAMAKAEGADYQSIVKREYTAANEAFIKNNNIDRNRIIYDGGYTSTLIVKASPDEIAKLAGIDDVKQLDYYDDAAQTNSGTKSAGTLTEHDGLKYIVSESGEETLYSGWTKKGNDYYYYKNGEKKKYCWLTSGGKRIYFLKADGARATGKVTIQGVEYEFDEKGVILPDKWGLELTAKNVTPAGCTIVFTQSGGNHTGELGTGSPYVLEKYKSGKWTAVEMLPQEYDVAWTAEGWIIKNNDSVEFTENWKWLYGELPAGKYRIGKSISDWRKPGDYDEKMYYAYFEITAKDVEQAAVISDFEEKSRAQAGAVEAYSALSSAFVRKADGSEEYPDFYAGAWIGDDNLLHIALTKTDDETAAQFRKLTNNSRSVAFEERKYALNELEKIRKVLDSSWTSKYNVSGHYVDQTGNACVFEFVEEDLSAIEKDLDSSEMTKKLNSVIPGFDKNAVVIAKGEYVTLT